MNSSWTASVIPQFLPVLAILTFTAASGAALSQVPGQPGSQPTAEAIMARVAANQDKADSERDHYLYVQHAHVVSRKGKTIMCEETTDARITPSSEGSTSEILKLDGRLLQKGEYVPYSKLPGGAAEKTKIDNDHDSLTIEMGDGDTDRDLVESLRSDLTDDQSKDGIGAGLFPLTSTRQSEYLFHLDGRERMNGHEVFHVDFRPKEKRDMGWRGDAYIDTTAYEPLVVSTTMARKVPFAVRTFLGTNLPGLGFTVVYAPQPEGVWFPVSFGTEFKLRVLFFFNREIIIDAHNREFEKTHVSANLVGAGSPD